MMSIGCNKDDDKTDSSGPANISGTWRGNGTIDGQSGSYLTSLTLAQDGGSVTGTIEGNALSGTFDGTTLSLTITPFTRSGANFTGNITGTFDGTYINNVVIVLNGSSGSRKATVTGRAPRLTRSSNFEDETTDFMESLSSEAESSLN